MPDFAQITIRLTGGENLPDTVEEWDESGLDDAMQDLREAVELVVREHLQDNKRPFSKYNLAVILDE